MADNAKLSDADIGRPLHVMFREQAARTPERAAIVGPGEGDQISYKRLDEASDQLAGMLLRYGVKKDSKIGILMERSNEYALAYVGILKAGAAYMPLDPAYPENLLADVLSDSEPEVVICKRSFVARLPETQAVILLDSSWEGCLTVLSDQDKAAVAAVDDNDLDALAYVVYSSGTTGKPKGIACPHRGAVFSYNWRFDNIPYREDVIEVEGCNVFFVWEMLRPLLRGQSLCVIPDNVIYDPPALSAYVEQQGITRMLFTPSLLEAVLDCKTLAKADLSSRMKTLDTIILCGEVVTVALQERTRELLQNASIWNLYSVSECHDVAAIELTDGQYGSRKYCPVGRLFKGVEAYVLESIENEDGSTTTPTELAPKPMGEVGELYVAGPTLARSYVKLDKLTAERFPTIGGKRLYKTGDRARVLPSRELEILGRCDSMVKIRGYSVELRAIEAAVMALTELVTSCCVVVQGDEGEDKFVIAYVVLRKPDATCRKVRMELKAKLPHYMVPAYLVEMNELPTHEVSGKLNKKALPPVDTTPKSQATTKDRSQSTELDCALPRTDLEWDLLKIWCQIMNMQQIDVIYDSFFDIGGHSLLAARLVEAIKVELGKDVGVVDLFTHSTIEKLALFIEQGHNGAASSSKMIDLKAEVDVFDASKEVNDIAMRAFWRSTNFGPLRVRSVLITGATGFLGSFLLYELLLNPDIDVAYCVVRKGSDEVTVQDRIRNALESRGLWREDLNFGNRIQTFAGDAALHHMGLDDDDYAALSTAVDVVVHCAAAVNLVYPYEGLRAANVVGTRNMIEFALLGKVKRLAYISTNGIFPDGMQDVREDADISGFSSKLQSGYSQSKWVAEQLVRRAADRGLPVVIFRPGNMGGDSGSRGGGKSWNASDFNCLVLTGCIELGAAPDVPGWLMEMTPVDVAAQGIVEIINENKSLGETFHVTNCGNCLEANTYFDSIRSAGYVLAKCNFRDWLARVKVSESPSLARLKNAMLAAPDLESLQALSTFDNSRFVDMCKKHDIVLPRISTSVMHEYLETWHQIGWVPAPQAPGRQLHGKVAIVTGASSGIGAAMARHLALAGASVAIGGRRLERLETLAQEIEQAAGSRVLPFKVDVTDREQVKSFVAAAESAFGPVDIYVSNAGVMHYTKVTSWLEDAWAQELDVNCKGLLHSVGAVMPGMVKRKSGIFVATSSDAGRSVFPGLASYSASKHYVEAFLRGVRREVAESGIRVLAVQPGDCKTELTQHPSDPESNAEFAQSSSDRSCWLDPDDVARAVLYAVCAPPHVALNEILIEPRAAPV
mmetsp:Transcript_5586/g.10471  ORF Transcript_5586/g.10471 Transcript_5586/m.10471 type:complete len:1297 (+) Transcript_5586:166-4056(+)